MNVKYRVIDCDKHAVTVLAAKQERNLADFFKDKKNRRYRIPIEYRPDQGVVICLNISREEEDAERRRDIHET